MILQNQKIYFATKHHKNKILEDHFFQIGVICEPVEIDTDQYGTFSGEKERTGSVGEVLQKKVRAVLKIYPDANWILASEGTFGPDPYTGLFTTDQESLLLWDSKNNIELYVHHISPDVVHERLAISSKEFSDAILDKLKFPTHGVIVHPENKISPIYKGIHDLSNLQDKILECEKISETKKVVIMNDLRAMHSPTRQKVIEGAGKKLIEKLKITCPDCHYPGFDIQDYQFGLPCSNCHRPTKNYIKIIRKCMKCGRVEEKNRSDGLEFEKPENCIFCNP